MKLYQLMFRHYSQKDSQEGILCYVVANSDESMYEYLRGEPTIPDDTDYGTGIYVSWMYKDDPENEDGFEEGFRERLIACGGEMFDKEEEVSDTYYGVTHYGWKCACEEITQEQIEVLRKVGITVLFAQ